MEDHPGRGQRCKKSAEVEGKGRAKKQRNAAHVNSAREARGGRVYQAAHVNSEREARGGRVYQAQLRHERGA